MALTVYTYPWTKIMTEQWKNSAPDDNISAVINVVYPVFGWDDHWKAEPCIWKQSSISYQNFWGGMGNNTQK